MEKKKVDIVLLDGAKLPVYEYEAASGCDLKAMIDKPCILRSLERVTVPTGIKIGLSEGYEVQIRPTSGLVKKHGIMVVLGTVDGDYRGELCVTLINLSREDYLVTPGQKIAQLVLAKVIQADWNVVNKLSETVRGEKGFGSTDDKQ